MAELGHMGDGVYLSFDGYQYWLAVNNHHNKVVAIDPMVWARMRDKISTHNFGKATPDAND